MANYALDTGLQISSMKISAIASKIMPGIERYLSLIPLNFDAAAAVQFNLYQATNTKTNKDGTALISLFF